MGLLAPICNYQKINFSFFNFSALDLCISLDFNLSTEKSNAQDVFQGWAVQITKHEVNENKKPQSA